MAADFAATAAEDRALMDHIAALRRKKITLNEDEIWYLYRLAVADLSTNTPCGIANEDHDEHRNAGHMALAKLSDAHMDLTVPKEGGV
jgi:hypothetical protein